MLVGTRTSDGQTVTAYLGRKQNGLFRCPECGDHVILKTGRDHANYFACEFPLARHYAEAESDALRACT